MALVLCADHEMNASTFTARCIASTGASLRAAVLGGLSALSGSRHGAMTTRVENLWRGLGEGPYGPALQQRLASGEDIPGLGHPLYPQGDVRAKILLEQILPSFPGARELIEQVRTLTGQEPSVDFALVVLRRHLRLPEGAAFTLFALGRSVAGLPTPWSRRSRGS